MVLWFVVLAGARAAARLRQPGDPAALSPTYALTFVVEHPFIAFVAMGGVVLTITGAEALYADMGHFGAKPIRLALVPASSSPLSPSTTSGRAR